jgi:ABC-type amino acid transport/signal transduction systems, periplasmic component/domain
MNRIVRTSTAIITSALLLTGCASGSAASTSASASSTATETLRVGMECNYAPFNWSTTTTNDTTQPISSVDYCDGYDVVIATKLAEATNRKVQIVKLDWDNLILSLNNNQIDAIIAGMTDTAEREQEVAFTDPYYESEEVMESCFSDTFKQTLK